VWPIDRLRARDLAHAARVDIQRFLDGLDPADTSMTFQRKEQGRRLARSTRGCQSSLSARRAKISTGGGARS
jgi:hypothetical protein